MSHEDSTKRDHDLLARLNALKKSSVTLNQSHPVAELSTSETTNEPNPAQALHADLLSRFNLLKGRKSSSEPSAQETSDGQDLDDGKTIEELLADLGPSSRWDITKSDEEQIEDLLQSAQKALKHGQSPGEASGDQHGSDGKASKPVAAVDVSVFQPESEIEGDEQSDEDNKPQRPLQDEADETLDKILDELRHEEPQDINRDHEEESSTTAPSFRASADMKREFDFPTSPTTDLQRSPTTNDTEDEALSSRFASLSLPSVPTTFKTSTSAHSVSTSKPGFTDEEVDDWCIICLTDATLQCIGCDGDLYCSNCWVEGHRGPDAGYEERTHKAVQFVKKRKKQTNKKVAVGAR